MGAGFAAFAMPHAAEARPAPAMLVKPDDAGTRARTSLHQDVLFDARPHQVYAALTNASAFAEFTGRPATIEPRAGGNISLFGGLVVGRNIELVPNKRIVQAWRVVQDFAPGVYSLVKMELTTFDHDRTLLVLDQTGFPEGHFAHLDQGWAPRYWLPMKKFLASKHSASRPGSA